MSDPYRYLDPDHTYTEPQAGVLRNLLGITDPEILNFVESSAVTKRLQELSVNRIRIKGIDDLFVIHEYLFRDVYLWAGKKRVVEISKDGKQFFPTANFPNALRYVDQLISEFKKIPKANKKAYPKSWRKF